DVALVVADEVPAAEVEAALRGGAGELLESVRLFDRYTDPERLGEGRKSLAYARRFRAPDRTLTLPAPNAAQPAPPPPAHHRHPRHAALSSLPGADPFPCPFRAGGQGWSGRSG